MKKIILAFILCLLAAGSSFAQNNMEGMRFLTINALMQYGQKLYDRGNFYEATAVFNHVLAYDAHQRQALHYLKNMGQVATSYVSKASKPSRPQPNVIVIRKSDDQIVNTVDVSNDESLKEAIEAKKHSIEKLKAQINKLRMVL